MRDEETAKDEEEELHKVLRINRQRLQHSPNSGEFFRAGSILSRSAGVKPRRLKYRSAVSVNR